MTTHAESLEAPTPVHALSVRASTKNMWRALAVLGVVVMGVGIATGKPSGLSTLAVVGVLMAVWTSRAQVVRVFDQHLELRAAPLASLKVIRFADIRDVTRVANKRIELRCADGEKERKVVVPLHLLSPEDAGWLSDHLSKVAG